MLVGYNIPIILRRSWGIDQQKLIREALIPGFIKGEAFVGDEITIDITLV